jgi:hypothetical protein
MQQRTGRRQLNAIPPQQIDHGFQPIEQTGQIGPPDIASIDHAEREDHVLGRLRSDFIELILRADQIEMKPGDGERQGQIEVVAKFAKVGVQHDPELRDRFGKSRVSLLQRLPGGRVEIEHQTWLIQLHPFGASVGQFPEHLDIDGQQSIEQRHRIE